MIYIDIHSSNISYPQLLTIQLVPSSETAYIGDIISYTVLLHNTSPYVLESIVCKVPLCSELFYIEDSLQVSGSHFVTLPISLGIPIEFLVPSETCTLSFSAQVLDTSTHTLSVQASALYKYSVPLTHHLKTHVVHSEKISITLTSLQLSATLIVDKTEATLHEHLHYTLKLYNNSSTTLSNILYTHTPCSATSFVPKSVSIKDGSSTANPTTTLALPTLKPNEVLTMHYAMRINSGTYSHYLSDQAKISFAPSGDISIPAVQEQYLEVPSVKLNITSFKNLCIDKLFNIPTHYPALEEIDSLECTVIIDEHYILPSYPWHSTEGTLLNAYQVMICGHIEVALEYTSIFPEDPLNIIFLKIPFSNFIVLPSDYMDESIAFRSVLQYSEVLPRTSRQLYLSTSFTIYVQHS